MMQRESVPSTRLPRPRATPGAPDCAPLPARRTLRHLGLAQFEIAQILNLCPENLEEAEALLPSLRLADRRAPRSPRVGRAASPCGLSSDRFTQIGVERERGRARQHGPAQRRAREDGGVPRHVMRRPTESQHTPCTIRRRRAPRVGA